MRISDWSSTCALPISQVVSRSYLRSPASCETQRSKWAWNTSLTIEHFEGTCPVPCMHVCCVGLCFAVDVELSIDFTKKGNCESCKWRDRKSVGYGKDVSGRVDLRVGRMLKNKQ